MPVYWPGGVRREDGASLICGYYTKRGKACADTVLAPQPTHSSHLDANEPPSNSMATTRPHEASLPKRAFRRQDPRQEPSALAAHAGICAGARPQGRSLPRSFADYRRPLKTFLSSFRAAVGLYFFKEGFA